MNFRSITIMLAALALCAACSSTQDSGAQAGGDGPEGSNDTSIQVMTPTEGAVVMAGALIVRGETAVHSEVEINNIVVEVVEGHFEAEITLEGNGERVIQIRAGEAQMERRVMVDGAGPTIEITHPARGAFLNDAQGLIEVKGLVTDISGIDEVSVNGAPTDLGADGSFSATVSPVPGMNLIEVSATDIQGQSAEDVRAVGWGQWAEWGRPADDAITARVSAEGLSLVSDTLSDNLGPELLADFDLSSAGAEGFELRGLEIGGVGVELIPMEGYLQTTIEIYGLDIKFNADFNGSPIRGEIEANPAELKVKVRLMADGQGGLDIAFDEAEVEMHDFDFDVGGLLGLFDWILKGTIEDEIEKALVEYLAGFIMEDVLTPEALSQSAEVLGNPADFTLLVTGVDVDPGGISLSMDAALDMDKAPGMPDSPGWFTTPGAAPEGGDADLRLSIADDFLNQLFGSLWRAGALQINLGEVLDTLVAQGVQLPITFDVGTLAALTNTPKLLEIASPETKVGVLLRPMMPPIVQLGEGDKLMHIGMGEVIFEFSAELSEGPKHWASVSAHMDIDVSFEPDENGEPALSLKIDARADVVAAPLVPLDPPSAERALVSILELLPGLLTGDALGEAMDMGDAQAINPGLKLGSTSAIADGPQKDFLSLLIDLTIDVAPGPAPDLPILHTEINEDNGHTYHLLGVSSWSQAEAAARAMGGHLVTIRNDDENDWVMDTFGRWDGETRDMWIGLHDVGHEGEFTWVSGEVTDWERWDRKGQDNGLEDDDSSYGEDFVHIYGDRSPRRDGRWNDYKDSPSAPWNEGFHGLVEIIPDGE